MKASKKTAGMVAGSALLSLVYCSNPAVSQEAVQTFTAPAPTATMHLDAGDCGVFEDDGISLKPQAYLELKAECHPALLDARRDGMLAGILYNPSDEVIASLARKSLSGIARGEELEEMVRGVVSGNENLSPAHVGTIMPRAIGMFGSKKPLYIVIPDEFFSSYSVKNEADRDSILTHEAVHLEDFYSGVFLNDVELSFDTINPVNFRLGFLEELLELRAVYTQLENIYRDAVEGGSMRVSPGHFAAWASNYRDHWNFVNNNPVTELERKAGSIQIEQFSGIVPEERDSGFALRFYLFGIENRAVFERR